MSDNYEAPRPVVDMDTGEKMRGLGKADEAMRKLRRAVVELVRGAAVSEAMPNGDKIAFIHAITRPDYLADPVAAQKALEKLAEESVAKGRGEGWRYNRAADAFYECELAGGATILRPNWPSDEPMTEDGAEEGVTKETANESRRVA